jgi:hypothetical protein
MVVVSSARRKKSRPSRCISVFASLAFVGITATQLFSHHPERDVTVPDISSYVTVPDFSTYVAVPDFSSYAVPDFSSYWTVSSTSKVAAFSLAYEESLGFFDDIASHTWELLKQKVRQMGPNTKGDPLNDLHPGRFFQSHYEPNFVCQHERRIGRQGDGGKWQV